VAGALGSLRDGGHLSSLTRPTMITPCSLGSPLVQAATTPSDTGVATGWVARSPVLRTSGAPNTGWPSSGGSACNMTTRRTPSSCSSHSMTRPNVVDRDLGMTHRVAPDPGQLHTPAEAFAVNRTGVEDRLGGVRHIGNGGPDEMGRARQIDRHRGAVIRTAVQHPPVFTHPGRRGERRAAIHRPADLDHVGIALGTPPDDEDLRCRNDDRSGQLLAAAVAPEPTRC
jgi:hypothetical protein